MKQFDVLILLKERERDKGSALIRVAADFRKKTSEIIAWLK